VSFLGNLGSSLGDLNPFNKSKAQAQADSEASANIANAKEAYGGLTPPTFKSVDYKGPEAAQDVMASKAGVTNAQAVGVGPSAMNGISTNPQYTQAQQAQMAALGNLAANGGRNAASDQNLALIQQQENANAKGQRDAILQNANMRGQGGSGASLLAQLSSSQNATNNQSAQDLGVMANQQNTALAAGQGAAQIGSNLQNSQFNQQAQQAAANDAIARFNAQNAQGVGLYNAQAANQADLFNAQQGTGVNLFNAQKQQAVNNAAAAAANQNQTVNNIQLPQQAYEDQFQKASGMSGASMGAANYYNGLANSAAQKQGGLISGVSQLGSAVANTSLGQSALGTMGLDAKPAAKPAAAHGGRVPGMPRVGGDSPLNDIVPIKTSPGEVVVPRSLALGGSKGQIGSFVQHAPTIKPPMSPDKDKEAMLSALHNLGRR
jgi:hypothetical protein